MNATATATTLRLDPGRALALELPRLRGPFRRAALRGLLAASAGSIRIEGAERLKHAPEPSIFALTHHNAWEALLAPATLIALRRGRPVRFLVDWMYVHLPWSGWLLRAGDPIPVWGKRARFGLRERFRRARGRDSPLERALEALRRGEDVGIYPEGRRNPDPFVLCRPRRGLGVLAVRTGAPVVPVGIDFPARDRLGRTPRAGRFVLRVGEPIDCAASHRQWSAESDRRRRRRLERDLAREIGSRACAQLARLSRKIHLAAALEPGRADSDAPPRAAASTPSAPAERVRVERVLDARGRRQALAVLREVYRSEKGWLREVEGEIPPDPATDTTHAWLLARVGERPVGALRVSFDPPLELPAEAGVELDPGVDAAALAASGRFAEVGRLVILPEWRSRPAIVLELMRATFETVIERGCSHLLTAVFEDDPHSPYRFHTRVLGFERIGTHRHGELACASRRILLVLDIARAYRRMRSKRARLLAQLAGGVAFGVDPPLPEASAL